MAGHMTADTAVSIWGEKGKEKERNKSLFDKEQQRIKQYAQWDSRKPTKKTQHNKKSEQANYKQ